jgi:hypothetical protein
MCVRGGRGCKYARVSEDDGDSDAAGDYGRGLVDLAAVAADVVHQGELAVALEAAGRLAGNRVDHGVVGVARRPEQARLLVALVDDVGAASAAEGAFTPARVGQAEGAATA